MFDRKFIAFMVAGVIVAALIGGALGKHDRLVKRERLIVECGSQGGRVVTMNRQVACIVDGVAVYAD